MGKVREIEQQMSSPMVSDPMLTLMADEYRFELDRLRERIIKERYAERG
jgi:hypothetical protein